MRGLLSRFFASPGPANWPLRANGAGNRVPGRRRSAPRRYQSRHGQQTEHLRALVATRPPTGARVLARRASISARPPAGSPPKYSSGAHGPVRGNARPTTGGGSGDGARGVHRSSASVIGGGRGARTRRSIRAPALAQPMFSRQRAGIDGALEPRGTRRCNLAGSADTRRRAATRRPRRRRRPPMARWGVDLPVAIAVEIMRGQLPQKFRRLPRDRRPFL